MTHTASHSLSDNEDEVLELRSYIEALQHAQVKAQLENKAQQDATNAKLQQLMDIMLQNASNVLA
jgi:hypothetical protein